MSIFLNLQTRLKKSPSPGNKTPDPNKRFKEFKKFLEERQVNIGVGIIVAITLMLWFFHSPGDYKAFMKSGNLQFVLIGVSLGVWLMNTDSKYAKFFGKVGVAVAILAFVTWAFPFYLKPLFASLPSSDTVRNTYVEETSSGDRKSPLSGPYKAFVEKEFGRGHVMVAIAGCESGWNHYDPKVRGKVLTNREGGDAKGLFQIRPSVHLKRASAEGIDLDTPEGQVAMARIIHDSVGTKPWTESKPCWTQTSVLTRKSTVDTLYLGNEWSREIQVPVGMGITYSSLSGETFAVRVNGRKVIVATPKGCHEIVHGPFRTVELQMDSSVTSYKDPRVLVSVHPVSSHPEGDAGCY